jgi:putative phosphoribosyl transferase
MRFRDREDAGRQLAEVLAPRVQGDDAIIYPLPRGGVPLGVEIARVLHMPVDLIIPRKIGHPYNPEYAIGAVTEHGDPVINEAEVERADPAWYQAELAAQREEARRRRERYLGDRAPLPVEGKTAILVDDGIATGLTMRAAIADARQRHASRIVVAIPVAPKDTYTALAREVDAVVAVAVEAHYLGAVGAYYDQFEQLTDEEVIRLLDELRREQRLGVGEPSV